MKKIIRKIGNSVGVLFNKEEQQVHNIEVGDEMNLEDIYIHKKKKRGV